MKDILEIIKEEYIADKPYIKSVKQLDFYISRNKTVKFLNHYIENHELGSFLKKDITPEIEKVVNDYLLKFEDIKQQKADSVSFKNDDYINNFIEYYTKKSEEIDLVEQPAAKVFNLSLVYNHPRSFDRIYSVGFNRNNHNK